MKEIYNYDLPKILYHIRPGSIWKIVNKTLVWLDEKESKPSYDDIVAGFLYFEKQRLMDMIKLQSRNMISEIMNENYNRHSELMVKKMTDQLSDDEEAELIVISSYMTNIENIKKTRDIMNTYIQDNDDIQLILQKESDWNDFVKYMEKN